jgi:branched-chain amino acid transport system permease protein
LLRAGQVSFGHALYLSLAAYVVAFGAVRVPEVLLLLPLAAAAAAVVGLVIGLFVSRYRAIFFGMLNLAFSMVFYSLVDKFYEITRGGDGIRVPATTFAGRSFACSARPESRPSSSSTTWKSLPVSPIASPSGVRARSLRRGLPMKY